VIHTIRTIDAHAAGEPLRLIVEGFPAPRGRTMLEKREWVRAKQDHFRRSLMLEPRGHADMYGAVLTEPVTAGSHAGVLFMHNQGYSTMCGHGIIAVATIALERSLLVPGGNGRSIGFDTPAGLVRASVTQQGERVTGVAFVNVPSFVLHGGLPVNVGSRPIRVDVAFGGAFYAIVDSESAGLPLDAAHLPELRRAGAQIKSAVERTYSVVHPLSPDLEGIYGTIFTGPPRDSRADLRNVTVFADAQVDRSPCGTGTAAVMAVVDAMGLLSDDKPFVHEGVVGTTFIGRIAGRTQVGDYSAILPEIAGSAWITGEHTFLLDDEDPLREGFRL
jgi:trans-L-3-hydroxyproline dehydratase